ncbi:hypothetical protein Patl1_15528 [Pistacia atlantica]|uniref:Uncharacterized protein n=1 Tax=Pistacia atlantica TaxID=434234 RepID=A0ACC1BBN0_9ROSI|nr:hypothetical protein Patl1_15528 [Pistacia atlantica]
MNLIILFLLASHVNAWEIFEFDQYPILKLTFLLLALCMLFLFLLTSITINLRFSALPITVRSGYFSVPLTVSLLATILLPPPLFWLAYFITIISSPWHGIIWNLIKCIFNWFVINLQLCSTFVIASSGTQQQEATISAPELAVDIEANPISN